MTATVTLGDRTYDLPDPSIRIASAWRQELARNLAPIVALIEDSQQEIATVADLGLILRQIGPAVLAAPDTIAGLLLEWAPSLRPHWEEIEDTATDAQIMAAFLAVLRRAYPFGGLAQLAAPAPAQISNGAPPAMRAPI